MSAHTPTNSATTTAQAKEPKSTPVAARLPNRDKGHDHLRIRIDQEMTHEERYVEVSLKDFFKKFTPKGNKAFNKADAIPLDTEHLDVIAAGGKRAETKCYPNVVSSHRRRVGWHLS